MLALVAALGCGDAGDAAGTGAAGEGGGVLGGAPGGGGAGGGQSGGSVAPARGGSGGSQPGAAGANGGSGAAGATGAAGAPVNYPFCANTSWHPSNAADCSMIGNNTSTVYKDGYACIVCSQPTRPSAQADCWYNSDRTLCVASCSECQ